MMAKTRFIKIIRGTAVGAMQMIAIPDLYFKIPGVLLNLQVCLNNDASSFYNPRFSMHCFKTKQVQEASFKKRFTELPMTKIVSLGYKNISTQTLKCTYHMLVTLNLKPQILNPHPCLCKGP